MIVMTSAECIGKLKLQLQKKEETVVIVDTFEEYRANYSNIMSCDVVLYNGDPMEYIAAVTPDNAKKVLLHITANPDIVNLELLSKLKSYGVLMSVAADYCDMQHLYELNQMYPNIRFCGGNFIYIDGVNLGLVPVKKLKRVVLTDTYSCQDDVHSLKEIRGYEFLPVKAVKVAEVAEAAEVAQESVVVDTATSDKVQAGQKSKTAVIKTKQKSKEKPKKSTGGYKTGGISMF